MANETKKRLLLSKWRAYQDAGSEGESERLESTLLTVRDWMLGVLVHHRPMSDPRVILRKVEEAIGT